MKRYRHILAAVALTAAAALSANAQTAPAAGAAQPGNAAIGEAKVALINTQAFTDDKVGIQRIVSSVKRVDAEFTTRRNELQGLRTRYETLVKEIDATKTVADSAALSRKADEAETLKRDIERKAQDAQSAYEKRMRETLNPLQEDVYKALEAFAKARGITVIIDASQVPILYSVDQIDITRAFIAEYNQRNPATSAAATTTPAGAK
ncbi:MAG TPA: OmpH family outer membrane protein [Pyrinomonadaceae bacterium]